MRLMRVVPLAVALTLVAGACGDSTGPQVEMTDAEIELLFEAISEVLAEADVPLFLHETSLSRIQPQMSSLFLSSASQPPVSFSASASCDEGGTFSVSGSGNSDETSFDFDIQEIFNDCDAGDFTIDGDINIDGNGTSTESSADIEMNVDGNLTVETEDGRTGACRLDYGFTLTSSGTSFTFEIHGTICGRDVEDIISQQDI